MDNTYCNCDWTKDHLAALLLSNNIGYSYQKTIQSYSLMEIYLWNIVKVNCDYFIDCRANCDLIDVTFNLYV